jgi:hypothetical protein
VEIIADQPLPLPLLFHIRGSARRGTEIVAAFMTMARQGRSKPSARLPNTQKCRHGEQDGWNPNAEVNLARFDDIGASRSKNNILTPLMIHKKQRSIQGNRRLSLPLQRV